MNLNRGKYLAPLFCAAAAVAVVMMTPGCSQECVDKFDCRGGGKTPADFICQDNKCVAAPEVDAGEVDAGPGEEEDAGIDAGEDAGEDAGFDAGVDAGEDAGFDAGVDAGEDAGVDAGVDAGTDAGVLPNVFSANLSGTQEVPPVTTTAVGTGTFTLTGNDLAFNVTHTVTAADAAHIHLGHAGLSGGIVHPLCNAASCLGAITGTWNNLSAQEIASLRSGDFYVNIHSATAPNGEIRGQLVVSGSKVYAAAMDGGTGVSGAAGFIVNPAGDSLHYHVTTAGVTGATQAHIYQLSDGGPILDLPGVNDTDWAGDVAVDAGVVGTLDADGGFINEHDTAGNSLISGPVGRLQ